VPALFQDRDSQTVFYCQICATSVAEKTADLALKDLLAIFKAKSSQYD